MEERGLKIEHGKANAGALRLFVAIVLPENLKDEIEKAQQELRAALPGNFVRWTKREQFHLTLKFLGNVAESRVTELIEVLRVACLNVAALKLRAERIGFFPDLRNPRVIWAGVHDEKGALPRFQESIETSVKDFAENVQSGSAGVSPARGQRSQEEKFTAHVTLGRIQRIDRSEAEMLSNAAAGITNQFFGEWIAPAIELIRSELSSAGSLYMTVTAIPLSGQI